VGGSRQARKKGTEIQMKHEKQLGRGEKDKEKVKTEGL